MIVGRRESRRKFLAKSVKGLVVSSLVFESAPVPLRSAEPELLAGVAKRKITPPLYVPYLTSSGMGTCAPFQALHDDLYARALVVDDGNRSTALLSVDSIGYDNTILGAQRNFTAELRKLISRRTGLRGESIMLAATHTHQAPETIALSNFREYPGTRDWLEAHLADLAETVIAAWKNRVSVRVRFGKTEVEGIGRSRRVVLKNGKLNVHGPMPSADQIAHTGAVDSELAVLYFENMSGVPHAIVINYATHPVVTMLLKEISADYPGAASAYVESSFPGAVCLFTQGCGGNINSIHVSSSFDHAVVLGEKLGKAVVQQVGILNKASCLPNCRVNFASKTVTVASRKIQSLRDAERIYARQPDSANATLLRMVRKLDLDGPVRAEIQAMSVGPIKWVSLPGEPFAETGLGLKRAGASFVVGYANGYLGYFPIRTAYDEGGYDVAVGSWSRVAPGTAEMLEHAARDLVARLGY